jgi:segregation and condensation protein B
VPGKPALFGTTKAFLDYFGLSSLDDLPSLAEIKDMGELEPELELEPVADQPEERVSGDEEPGEAEEYGAVNDETP